MHAKHTKPTCKYKSIYTKTTYSKCTKLPRVGRIWASFGKITGPMLGPNLEKSRKPEQRRSEGRDAEAVELRGPVFWFCLRKKLNFKIKC